MAIEASAYQTTAAGPSTADPSGVLDAAIEHARDNTAQYQDPMALATQEAALQAGERELAQLGAVLSGQPGEIRDAILVLLVATRDLLHAGGLGHVGDRFQEAYTSWDSAGQHLDTISHEAWTTAGQHVYESASTAYLAWGQARHALLVNSELSAQYADLLADWVVQSHADLLAAAVH